MTTTAPRFRTNGPDPTSGGCFRCDLPANGVRLVERALKKQWRWYRKQLKRCQKEFTERTIHDSRVGARRLLSAVELLSGFISARQVRKVQRALKEHLGTFNALRDTQVQLPVIEKLQRVFPAARPFCAFLQGREKRLIRSTRKNIKQVGTARIDRLIAACRDEVRARRAKCSPEEAVGRLLESVDRAFACASELRASIDPGDTETIHRTRVAFKKFRYMVETLAACRPKPAPQLLDAMHRYQTMMGNVQDAEMLRLALEKFLRKHPLARGFARPIRQDLLLRRQRLIDTYLGAAGQMRRFWPRGGRARATQVGAPRSNGHSIIQATSNPLA